MSSKRFSPKRNTNKTNMEKVTKEKPILYKFLDKDDKNIYTGISKRGQGPERLKDHLPKGSDPIPGAKTFRTKEMPSIDQAKKEESKIIKTEKPKHNKRK